MKTKFFETIEAKAAECDKLIDEDHLDSCDRATISAFYSGQDVEGKSSAKARGAESTKNYLFGHDNLAQASEQLYSINTRNPVLWHIDFPQMAIAERNRAQKLATDIVNTAIKRSRRFAPHYRAICNDVTLFGRGVLAFMDPWDWCPKFVNPLAPAGAGTIAEDIPYLVLPDEISLSDLVRYEKRASQNGSTYWNERNLSKAIDHLLHKPGEDGRKGLSDGTSHHERPDEYEFKRQENRDRALDDYDTKLEVYWFWQQRPDKIRNGKAPWDVTLIARYAPDRNDNSSAERPGIELYHEDEVFKDSNWLHPFFLDTNMGGRTTFHRTMGLGRLNYEPDTEFEAYFNDVIQGSREILRRMYQIGENADMDWIERWGNGDEDGSILPAGLNIVEFNKSPNFQAALTPMQFLQNLSSTNASNAIGQASGGRGRQLEVEVIANQGRNALAVANRFNEHYQAMDALGAEVVRRIGARGGLQIDAGYSVIKEVRDRFAEEGLPIDLLTDPRTRVRTNRSAGDGNKVQERIFWGTMFNNLNAFNPEGQDVIKREYIASQRENYDLADQIVPSQVQPDGNQIDRANTENNTAFIQLRPPTRSADDIDGIHAAEHLAALQSKVQAGLNGDGWTIQDAQGYGALEQHLQVDHLTNMANAGGRGSIKGFTDQLAALNRQARNLSTAAIRAQQAQQQELSPMDAARIQDMQIKQQLAIDTNARNNRGQRHRERESAVREVQENARQDVNRRRINLDEQRFLVDAAQPNG